MTRPEIDGAAALVFLAEAEELLGYARRYLIEFGAVDPETLGRRIDAWRNDLAVARGRARNAERTGP